MQEKQLFFGSRNRADFVESFASSAILRLARSPRRKIVKNADSALRGDDGQKAAQRAAKGLIKGYAVLAKRVIK